MFYKRSYVSVDGGQDRKNKKILDRLEQNRREYGVPTQLYA